MGPQQMVSRRTLFQVTHFYVSSGRGVRRLRNDRGFGMNPFAHVSNDCAAVPPSLFFFRRTRTNHTSRRARRHSSSYRNKPPSVHRLRSRSLYLCPCLPRCLVFLQAKKSPRVSQETSATRGDSCSPHHCSRRKIKITRRSSDRSEDSLLPRFCYEATIMPMDTESIVTSRATTISHCNSTIEYVCDFPVDQEWEFPREQLSFSGEGYGEELGKGAFGKVVKARAANIRGRPGISDVAVKMPKGKLMFTSLAASLPYLQQYKPYPGTR